MRNLLTIMRVKCDNLISGFQGFENLLRCVGSAMIGTWTSCRQSKCFIQSFLNQWRRLCYSVEVGLLCPYLIIMCVLTTQNKSLECSNSLSLAQCICKHISVLPGKKYWKYSVLIKGWMKESSGNIPCLPFLKMHWMKSLWTWAFSI